MRRRGLLAVLLFGLLALGAVMLGPRLAQSVVGGGIETGPVAVGTEVGVTAPGAPDGPVAPGIPMPIVDGGYHYSGDGRFLTDTGREFFWRNDRFENPDGSLMEVPKSVNEKLRARGLPAIEEQPTAPPFSE